jgi:hypothetical protein
MAVYKCCWNCQNGFTVCSNNAEQVELWNASKRMCCASYPVSNHLENPFKQRYCKQFEEEYHARKGHLITKAEAQKLMEMTPEQLIKYWEHYPFCPSPSKDFPTDDEAFMRFKENING